MLFKDLLAFPFGFTLQRSTTANNGEENSLIKRKIDHFVANRLSPFDFFLCQYDDFLPLAIHAHKRFLCSNSSFSVTFFFFNSARAVENDPIDWRSLFPSSMRHELKIKTERSKKIFPEQEARRSTHVDGEMLFANAEVASDVRLNISRQLRITFRHRTAAHRAAHVCAHKSSCSSVHLEVY